MNWHAWAGRAGRRTAAVVVLGFLMGCGGRVEVEPPPADTVVTIPEVDPAPQPSSPAERPAATQTDYFREAVNRASSAVAIGQTAQSPDDWSLAVARWQQAIQLMGRVPVDHPQYATAQTKVAEYQQNLAVAQRQVSGDRPTPATAPEPQGLPAGLAAQIPIVERRGGTPVVRVTLTGTQGERTMSMLFDTGATLTLITPAMASAIGVPIVDRVDVKIADGSVVTLPIGYIDTLEVGGLTKQDVLVAIGGDAALLGQDVYGEFGIAMGSHLINLHK